MQKRCRKCGRERLLADFPVKKGKPESPCRDCRRNYDAAYNAGAAGKERNRRGNAKSNARRTPEQRRAEKARAAAKAGRLYTPGVSMVEGRRLARIAGVPVAPRTMSDRELAARAMRMVRSAQRSARRASIAAKQWNKPGLTAAARFMIRYRLDPEFAIRNRLRSHARRKRQGRVIGETIRAALKGGRESPRIERFAGWTISQLRAHLERQFDRRMTWAAFCRGEIHIDHRRPLSSFDLSDPEELRAAWALTNLQPLWARQNLEKGARRELLV